MENGDLAGVTVEGGAQRRGKSHQQGDMAEGIYHVFFRQRKTHIFLSLHRDLVKTYDTILSMSLVILRGKIPECILKRQI